MAKTREEYLAYRRAYYAAHREKKLAQQKAYSNTHKEEIKAYQEAHKEERKQHRREYYLAHREADWEKREQLKLEVFTHYSGKPPKCATCGEIDIIILTIDHINNDGAKHRKERGTGMQLYRWLKKNNYPKGFQVLCAGCNMRKEHKYRRAKIQEARYGSD